MILQNIKMALSSLRLSKLRSFLTMLGIIIGVTAVITVVSLGEGLKQAVTAEIEGFGANLVQVSPGNAITRGEDGEIESFNFSAAFGVSTLTERDVEKIREIDNVDAVAPVMLISAGVKKDSGSKEFSGPFTFATNSDYPEVFPTQEVDSGEWFNDSETGNVVVVGNDIAEEFFPEANPIGQTILLKNQPFTIVAVMKPFESALDFGGGFDFNKAVTVPFEAGKRLNQGIVVIIEIDIAASSVESMDQVADDVATLLTDIHGEKDFSVIKQDEFSAITDNIVGLLTSAVVGLTSISLLVAGVGVMNIMLVSVTERTREIGIRKAIGASNRHILTQFLIEAVVLSVVGGVLGVFVSYLLGFPIESQLGIKPVLTTQAFLLAFLVTSGVGIIFGIAPALKAARKDPIDALRYE